SRWPFIYAGLIPTPEQTPGSGRTRTPLPWTQPTDACTIYQAKRHRHGESDEYAYTAFSPLQYRRN
ncbi:hypothetical protein, partial [Streptomyces avermitilis]|uniref:hypothetical protein n=1 Tax=Streptomyces avermitilis TaxID=33903 RepID=UPI00381AAD9B